MFEQELAIGSLVHFVLGNGPNKGRCRAAIVTSIPDSANVDLHVFPARGHDHFKGSDWLPEVQHDPDARPGTFHMAEECTVLQSETAPVEKKPRKGKAAKAAPAAETPAPESPAEPEEPPL